MTTKLQWISVEERLPDLDKECLLFIDQYRSNNNNLWDSFIICGFWSNTQENNEEGFYSSQFTVEHLGCKYNPIDGVCNYEFLSDCEFIKITHWMPLPEPPR